MLKIIVPLAGSSELFAQAGYYYPKPLIEVSGQPMIEMVLQNPQNIKVEKSFIFIIREEDSNKFHLDNTLRLLASNCEVIKLKNSTKGGLCSVLCSIDLIQDNDEILIMNGDQIIDHDFNDFLDFWSKNDADAGLVTFRSVHPRWSYARIEKGVVMQTAEKNPISEHAIAGLYYFKSAKLFFDSAFEVIKNDVHLDGIYYISPVINEVILQNCRVIPFAISFQSYHLFYSPQVLNDFERKSIL